MNSSPTLSHQEMMVDIKIVSITLRNALEHQIEKSGTSRTKVGNKEGPCVN